MYVPISSRAFEVGCGVCHAGLVGAGGEGRGVRAAVSGAVLRSRIGHRMNSRVGLAHFGGVVVALTSAALTNAHLQGLGVEPTTVVVLAVYLPATMIGCGFRGYRLYLSRTGWLSEARSPSALEQRAVLGLPLREAIEGLVP